MKIISWNVNGLRAILNKGFIDFIRNEKPDIICLQEIKANREQVDLDLADYPYQMWNSAIKKGYSGTAVFSKIQPESDSYGIGIDKHDQEGRVITAEFKNFFLVNIYVPNSQRGLERLDYRHMEWDNDLLKYLKNLEKNKSVIFCGDLNVAHKESTWQIQKAIPGTQVLPLKKGQGSTESLNRDLLTHSGNSQKKEGTTRGGVTWGRQGLRT
jgi:exodeoxyribonuclease-3